MSGERIGHIRRRTAWLVVSWPPDAAGLNVDRRLLACLPGVDRQLANTAPSGAVLRNCRASAMQNAGRSALVVMWYAAPAVGCGPRRGGGLLPERRGWGSGALRFRRVGTV
jgi:hypothetical protein